ncbi:11459_t:CDS:2, partial [Ambispora gerdemannii]
FLTVLLETCHCQYREGENKPNSVRILTEEEGKEFPFPSLTVEKATQISPKIDYQRQHIQLFWLNLTQKKEQEIYHLVQQVNKLINYLPQLFSIFEHDTRRLRFKLSFAELERDCYLENCRELLSRTQQKESILETENQNLQQLANQQEQLINQLESEKSEEKLIFTNQVDELEEKKEEIKRLQAEIKVRELEKELELTQTQRDCHWNALAKAQEWRERQLNQLAAQDHETLANFYREAKRQISELQDLISQKNNSLTTLTNKKQKATQKIKELVQEKTQLSQEFAAESESLRDELETALIDKKKAIAEKDQTINQQQQTITKKTAYINKQQQQITNLKKSKTELQATQTILAKILVEINSDLDNENCCAKGDYEEIKQENQKKEQKIGELEQEIRELKNKPPVIITKTETSSPKKSTEEKPNQPTEIGESLAIIKAADLKMFHRLGITLSPKLSQQIQQADNYQAVVNFRQQIIQEYLGQKDNQLQTISQEKTSLINWQKNERTIFIISLMVGLLATVFLTGKLKKAQKINKISPGTPKH